jgi:hypothetical protein
MAEYRIANMRAGCWVVVRKDAEVGSSAVWIQVGPCFHTSQEAREYMARLLFETAQ